MAICIALRIDLFSTLSKSINEIVCKKQLQWQQQQQQSRSLHANRSAITMIVEFNVRARHGKNQLQNANRLGKPDVHDNI